MEQDVVNMVHRAMDDMGQSIYKGLTSAKIVSRGKCEVCIYVAKELGVRRALFHAFDGKAKYAEAAAKDPEVIFMFSVPPSIARSPQKQKLVER